jgi:glyoxylase-like metal-dependent hydrolase (beta-lactamase superfamily II)
MTTAIHIGDITIQRIVEMEGPLRPALDFFADLTPAMLDENRSWLREAGAMDADDKMVLCFQSYVIRTPHHTILVDSCVGNDKGRPGRPVWDHKTDTTYMDALAAAGLSVNDIDFVLCTHLHVDHVGWNTRLEDGRWVPTFPNARYLFSGKELEFWTAEAKTKPQPHIEDSVLPIVAAARADLVTSSHALGDHVRLLPTPGHTIDHFAVELGRGSALAVVTGDLIHSPLQTRYPELSMFADSDPALAATTRRSFLERYSDSPTLCCFAHFPSPSVGRLKPWGAGFRCDFGA